jgi:hypothetical protein
MHFGAGGPVRAARRFSWRRTAIQLTWTTIQLTIQLMVDGDAAGATPLGSPRPMISAPGG